MTDDSEDSDDYFDSIHLKKGGPRIKSLQRMRSLKKYMYMSFVQTKPHFLYSYSNRSFLAINYNY